MLDGYKNLQVNKRAFDYTFRVLVLAFKAAFSYTLWCMH